MNMSEQACFRFDCRCYRLKKLCLAVGSWFLSPVLSGVISVLMFLLIRCFVLNAADPLERGLLCLPISYGITIFINVFTIVHDGPSCKHNTISWSYINKFVLILYAGYHIVEQEHTFLCVLKKVEMLYALAISSLKFIYIIFQNSLPISVRDSIVGWGTMLQAGRLRGQFWMSISFSIYIILSAVLWPWDRLSL
jgi:hypothetical protein